VGTPLSCVQCYWTFFQPRRPRFALAILELVAIDNETDDDAALAANTNFSELVTPETVLALLQEIADLRRGAIRGRARY
jgi:hypothetical protein